MIFPIEVKMSSSTSQIIAKHDANKPLYIQKVKRLQWERPCQCQRC